MLITKTGRVTFFQLCTAHCGRLHNTWNEYKKIRFLFSVLWSGGETPDNLVKSDGLINGFWVDVFSLLRCDLDVYWRAFMVFLSDLLGSNCWESFGKFVWLIFESWWKHKLHINTLVFGMKNAYVHLNNRQILFWNIEHNHRNIFIADVAYTLCGLD